MGLTRRSPTVAHNITVIEEYYKFIESIDKLEGTKSIIMVVID